MATSLLKKFEGGLSYNEIESYTSRARSWYINELKSMRVNRQELLRDRETIKKSRLLPGRMFMFFYDPKHKATLPYYDQFPLILALEKAEKGGFYGLNFHYLDYRKRAILLARLIDNVTNQKFDETTRIRANYQILKNATKLAAFKPCFKHYLPGQIKSQIKMVPADYWETALFFPSEQFRKESKNSVFAKSRGMI
tara:strand:+ start:2869 stop:3456 length:588 start_codon:yes stop_codon:yes gene_type:complete